MLVLVQLNAGALMGRTHIHIAMLRTAKRSSGGPPLVRSVAALLVHGTPLGYGFDFALVLATFRCVLPY